MGSLALWYLGIWEAHEGRAVEARAIGDALAARAARSGDREETLLAQSVTARAALARGDIRRGETPDGFLAVARHD